MARLRWVMLLLVAIAGLAVVGSRLWRPPQLQPRDATAGLPLRFASLYDPPASPRSRPVERTVFAVDFGAARAPKTSWLFWGDAQSRGVREGGLEITSAGGDPQVVIPCGVAARDVDAVRLSMEVRVQHPIGRGWADPQVQVYWADDAQKPFTGDAVINMNWPPNTMVSQTKIIAHHPRWRGHIARLRLDPANEAATIILRKIELLHQGLTVADLLAQSNYTAKRLAIADTLEDVMYMPAPGRFSYRAMVPPEGVLSYACGMPEPAWNREARAVRFRVEVRDHRGRTVGRTTTIDPRRVAAQHWRTEQVDLSHLAGQTAVFTFSTAPAVASAEGAVPAVWGNPTLYSRRLRAGRPNVVIILADALRADHVGRRGSGGSLTPHLDRFAADAWAFTRAHSTTSWTSPSVAALFSSEYSSQSVDRGASPWGLRKNAATIADTLRRQGWQTAAITASPAVSPAFGLDRGFEVFDAAEAGAFPRPDSGEGVTRRALDWTQRQGDRPFFLYLHYMDTHCPYRPPDQFRQPALSGWTGSRTPGVDGGVPNDTCKWLVRTGARRVPARDVAHLRGLYDASVRHLDDCVGQLLQGLKAQGFADNTIVVFLADHGEEFWEHAWLEHGRTLYQESIAVPLIIRVPGGGRARVAQAVSTVDVAPTILSLVKVGRPPTMRGQSLARWIGDGPPNSAPLASELGPWKEWVWYPDDRNLAAVTDGRYKLIRDQESGARELYDLAKDPGERHNIARREPRIADRLVAAFGREVTKTVAAPATRARDSGLSKRAREALESLGYLQ